MPPLGAAHSPQPQTQQQQRGAWVGGDLPGMAAAATELSSSQGGPLVTGRTPRPHLSVSFEGDSPLSAASGLAGGLYDVAAGGGYLSSPSDSASQSQVSLTLFSSPQGKAVPGPRAR